MSDQITGATALLFPGQGVDVQELGPYVEDALPELAEQARQAIGEDPFARSGEATRFAQPAIYLASLAGLERIDASSAGWLSGHSLGEITALVAAGALDKADGLSLVVERGRLMDEAAAAAEPGGMLAVGSSGDEVTALAADFDLALANENSPVQTVLSGPADRIDAARDQAKEDGLRAKRLSVAGAFHSPAMEPAVAPFRELLETVELREPRAPIVSSVSARPIGSDDVRDLLARSIVSPVRWVGALRSLEAEGARHFFDVGPGKIVAGLAKRTLEGVAIESLKLPEPQSV